MNNPALTDEQIDAIFDQMPGGAQGFLKNWGYRQFAHNLLAAASARPAIDADHLMKLVRAYMAEVATGVARQFSGNFAAASSRLEQIEADIRALVAPEPQAHPSPTTGHWICADDVHRLVRGIDVALNGEHGAAKQAMLCDIAGLLEDECRKHGGLPLLELLDAAKSAEQLGKIAQAVRDFHYAMDTRQHGALAASTALDAVQSALGMTWVQGAEAARRTPEKHDNR